MRKFYYFGLEPIKARYTQQLSEIWIPEALQEHTHKVEFIQVRGADIDDNIKKGSVLDATGRGVYAMSQCQTFLKFIEEGKVSNNDIVYFQDFWHPGIESIYYSLQLYNIHIKSYAMLHAQTVDEYDFTYQMKPWMRHFELGIDACLDGIFVGSTIHKDQLKAAGFQSKINVVSLPFGKQSTKSLVSNYYPKRNNIIFTSRLDKEKNPYFLLGVVERFLGQNPEWTWTFTTSAKEFSSNLPNVIDDLYKLQSEYPNQLYLKKNLSKQEYYTELATSSALFNSSLQDYVSWTSIEAHTFNTAFLCPNFRSFVDFTSDGYTPFSVHSAIELLNRHTDDDCDCIINNLSDISDFGRRFEIYYMVNDLTAEYNIWHEYELMKNIINE